METMGLRKGFGCLEGASQIHQILVVANDCPQDSMAELIQRFFPSQDGINFVANQIASDMISQYELKHKTFDPQSLRQRYPEHLIEQVIMAFFLKKQNDKKEFLDLFSGMAPLTFKDSEFLKSPDKVNHFLSQQYSGSELNFDHDHTESDLLNEPEKIVLYALEGESVAQPLPRVLGYAQAKHSSLHGGTYADCGETSLRNFFNMVLYNPKTRSFDAQFLQNLQSKNPELRKARKSKWLNLLTNRGGERGIRTLVRLSSKHAFEA